MLFSTVTAELGEVRNVNKKKKLEVMDGENMGHNSKK